MNNFLNKMYLSRFLDSFMPIGVIFVLLFSRSGLSPFQISILISIWSLTTILLEVPMGVLADKYSRRNLLIIGLIIRAIGFGFWIMGGFINFAIGFVFWGIKNALTSGTLESFVYDELSAFNKEGQYEKVSGYMSGAFSIGLVMSAIVGGVFAEVGFSLVLITSIITTLLAALVLLTTRQVHAIHSTGETKYWQVVKGAFVQIKTNPSLLGTILFICIVFAAFGSTDEYWPLIYEQLKFSSTTIGVLVSIVYGISTVSGYTVGYFKGNKSIPFALVILSGLLFLTFGISKMILLLPLVFVGIYLYQIASIKLEAEMQEQIKSPQRATISSMKSLVFELIYMAFVLFFGFFGSMFGVISILPITGAIVLVTTLLFFGYKHSKGE